MKRKKINLMKNKNVLLLSTIAMVMALSLTGCSSKVAAGNGESEEITQNEENEAEKNEADKVTDSSTTNSNNKENEKKQETSTSTNSSSNSNSSSDSNSDESGNTNSATQNMNGLTNLTYTSDKLGITFNVPESWKGKYYVMEESGKVSVYMKHLDNITGAGLLFIIKKPNVDASEILNDIDGISSVDINGETLTVGGPTGYCLDDGDSLTSTYNQMLTECVYPVNSIKSK